MDRWILPPFPLNPMSVPFRYIFMCLIPRFCKGTSNQIVVLKKSSLQRKEVSGQTDFTGKSSCNLFHFLPSKSASWFSLPHHSKNFTENFSPPRCIKSNLWSMREKTSAMAVELEIIQQARMTFAKSPPGTTCMFNGSDNTWPQKNGAWNLQKSDKSTRNNNILWYYGLATKKMQTADTV